MASPRTVDRIVALIRDTSSSLPEDAERALRRALRREDKGSGAATVLSTILKNVKLARENGTPLCQDTGTLTFFVDERLRSRVTPEAIGEAVAKATELGYLRRNTIDSVSGLSVDSNVCPGAPVIHYVLPHEPAASAKALAAKRTTNHESRTTNSPFPTITLLMKGGGSENMSRQYSLPDVSLGAGRDLEGVRKCVLDAVFKAQGYGCAPGVLGVCIGGDRASGYEEAKLQLLREIGGTSKDRPGGSKIRAFEKKLLEECNSLGIGPMGLGGKTTLLDVHVGSRPRVPASFFVTVAYLCWAARRRTVEFKV
jgi:fumarate hydratase class I